MEVLKRLVEEKEQKVPTSTNKPDNSLCQVEEKEQFTVIQVPHHGKFASLGQYY